MDMNEIRATFRRAFKGKPNLFTPHIVKYGRNAAHIWELSTDDDTRAPWGQMWGVTVLTLTGQKTNLSQSFHNKTAALAYANLV